MTSKVGKIVTVGSKGQIVIPVEARRAIDLQPGQRVELTVDDGSVCVRPIPRDLVGFLTGWLREGSSLTAALTREHAEEIEKDEARGH